MANPASESAQARYNRDVSAQPASRKLRAYWLQSDERLNRLYVDSATGISAAETDATANGH